MSKCKNCIHFDLCQVAPIILKIMGYDFKIAEETNCSHYKSKSLLVELPCEVGTPVFFFVEDVDSKIFSGKVVSITYEQNTIWIYCRYDNGLTYHHTIDDIGKTLFFTEEQAKAKLKEKENLK